VKLVFRLPRLLVLPVVDKSRFRDLMHSFPVCRRFMTVSATDLNTELAMHPRLHSPDVRTRMSLLLML
jgi:hypothetical protein